MSRAVLSIGSNMGDKLGHLQSVVDAMRDHLVAVSAVYETEPWGAPGQDIYLNAALIVESDQHDEWDWLAKGQLLEQQAERVREVHWGPRTLDVDILEVAGVVSDDPKLTLPHAFAHVHASRMVPWLEIDPDATIAGHGRVADLVAALPAEDIAGVRRRDDLVLRH